MIAKTTANASVLKKEDDKVDDKVTPKKGVTTNTLNEKMHEKVDDKVKSLRTSLPSTTSIFSRTFSPYSHGKQCAENSTFSFSFSSPLLYRTRDEKVEKGSEVFFRDISSIIQDGTKCSLIYEIIETNPEIIGSKELPLRNLNYYNFLKEDSDYIIKDILSPHEVVMIYGAPGSFKSYITLKLGLSVAAGNSFLEKETKQVPVLYFDSENNDQELKRRLSYLKESDAGSTPFYIAKSGLLMNQRKVVQMDFIKEMKKLILEKGIKIIIFDTLHRFCFYDENSADDLNLVYMQVFKPFQEMGLSIIFLHHTTKDGKYRGSGDLLGQVDCSYKIDRLKGSGIVKIINEKNRKGEIDPIKCKVNFQTYTNPFTKEKEIEKVTLDLLDSHKREPEEKGKSEKIKVFIKALLDQKDYRPKELRELCEQHHQDFSNSTLSRVIKELKDEKIISNKGKYLVSKNKPKIESEDII